MRSPTTGAVPNSKNAPTNWIMGGSNFRNKGDEDRVGFKWPMNRLRC